MRSRVLLLDGRSGREAVSAFRFTLQVICMACLVCGFLGCATRTTAKYKALLVDKTVASELRHLERIRIPSVSLRDVTLGRACAIMYVCDEDPNVLQTGGVLVTNRWEFFETLITISRENINLAEYYDAVCLAADAVWWVSEKRVYIREKNPPTNISASEMETKDPFDPRVLSHQ